MKISIGMQWPPRFIAGRSFYDGVWYYLHLGIFWVNVYRSK